MLIAIICEQFIINIFISVFVCFVCFGVGMFSYKMMFSTRMDIKTTIKTRTEAKKKWKKEKKKKAKHEDNKGTWQSVMCEVRMI